MDGWVDGEIIAKHTGARAHTQNHQEHTLHECVHVSADNHTQLSTYELVCAQPALAEERAAGRRKEVHLAHLHRCLEVPDGLLARPWLEEK